MKSALLIVGGLIVIHAISPFLLTIISAVISFYPLLIVALPVILVFAMWNY